MEEKIIMGKLKESINKVTITGRVMEIESRTGVNKNGVPYIGGTIRIETSPDNIIPISFYASEKTSKGEQNRLYKSLETVVTDYKTVHEHGDQADIVEATNVRIGENIFFPTSDRMVRGFQLNGAFFNRNNAASPKNEFIVSGEIVEVVEDIKDDVPTGTLTVRLLVIGYNDKANILDFKVEDPAGVNYIKATFSAGMEVKVTGTVIIDETIEEIKEETAFGEPIVNTIRRTERKLLITSATAPVESSIPLEERTRILAEREKLIQDKKAEAGKTAQAKSAGDFTL
jgi:hypothetical protein